MTTLYEYIKDKHPDARLNPSTLFVNLRCPYHQENHPSFGISLADGHGHCFSCGTSASLVEIIAKLEPGLGYAQRLKRARTLRFETPVIAQRDVVAPVFRLDDRIDYWLSRGFTLPAIDRFGFRSGSLQGEPVVIIPILDAKGREVGTCTRRVDPKTKGQRYLYSTGFVKSAHLWGILYLNQPLDTVYVTEGIIDAALLSMLGMPAVSRLGLGLSNKQRELLRDLETDVVLVIDADEAGIRSADTYAHYGYRIAVPDCPCCKDVGDQVVTHGQPLLAELSARQWLQELGVRGSKRRQSSSQRRPS